MPLTARAAPRLTLDARRLVHADSFTAVMLAAAVGAHIERDQGHSVVVQEPLDDRAWSRLHDAVGTLPGRARWSGQREPPGRDRDILMPVTRVEDDETADLLAHWIGVVGAATRLPASESRLLQQATATFADNALRHASTRSGLVAACREPQGNDLQIVCFSPGEDADSRSDANRYVRELAERSKNELGGLFALDTLARRRNIDATLRVATGHARLSSRGQRFRLDGDAPVVPGFVASLEIHMAP
ncbi:hypothetical protein OJ998_30100 [Solirubrobacter taibaiensis]|nr:hypothetical protein [Solirubrobacter taibaiensis]